MSLVKVAEEIRKNKSFLITSHVNLEGDAIGSELAMRGLLLSLGKQAVIVNQDSVPSEYRFLPGIKNIRRLRDLKRLSFDAFVALDCSDVGRFRNVARLGERCKVKINIDHHPSNSRFGNVNWIEPFSSSTTEMIYQLYQKLGIPLDKEMALCLYVGILTDTGSFHYPNTTARSLKIASELMRYNLAAAKIYKNIYENVSFADIELLSKIITTMQAWEGGRIVWFEIKKEALKRKKVSIDLSEHVLNFGRLVKEAEVVVLFKENLKQSRQIRINLRSKRLDVNKIAKAFGGGGHKNASGATQEGSLEDVKRRVLNKIKQQLRNKMQ
jgi:phosphoesterase RecJ-like protein